MGTDIKPGIYRARAITGSAQYGLSQKNEPQVALDLVIAGLDDHVCTVALSMAPAAMKYSIDRLRACGWVGKNILKLDGIDTNDVDVQFFFDSFEGRMRPKWEIMTAGSTFKLDKPLEDDERERLAALVLRTLEGADAQTSAARRR